MLKTWQELVIIELIYSVSEKSDLSVLYRALVLFIGMHVSIISQAVGINMEKNISAKQGIHKVS